MRVRITAFAFLSVLSSSAYAASALATECAGSISPCINDDVFWPHAGPATFAAVGSTETVAAGRLGFGLVTDYLSRPIVVQVPAPGPGGSSQYAVNDQVNGTFLWSFGVTDRLELDLALPLTFGQGGTGLQPVTGGSALHDTAQRDFRFGFAYTLVPHTTEFGADGKPSGESPFGLTGRLEVTAPSGDRDQFASDGTAVFVPSVAADFRRAGWTVGAEVGARLRPVTQLLDARVGTQLVTSLGVGYDILPKKLLTGTLEAWALPALAGQANAAGATLVPAEWQLSVRTAPTHGGDLSIQAGGGGAIPFDGSSQITTPRFRFTLGIRWEPRWKEAKKAPLPPVSQPMSAPAGGP
jgi:OOP family OmpA-OmpF porin